MKRNQLLYVLIMLFTFLAACEPAPTPVLPTLPPPTSPSPVLTENNPMPSSTTGEVVLELVGITETKSLTIADLQALPAIEGQAGIKTSTGRIFPPVPMKGVALAELATLMGGLDPSLGVNVVAKDGYAMTLSYDQITQGDFVAYDPTTGEERKMEEPLTVLLVYERDGQPIPEGEEGPLRLAIISSKNNQVTDGHWSVKWVNKIELKNLGKEWSLELEGPMSAEIDRNSFQSCTAPGCHQASWKDNQAQNWVGVPLWLLAGYVDDEIKHNGPAFNDALADAGYSLQIVATDGYSITLSSADVKRND